MAAADSRHDPLYIDNAKRRPGLMMPGRAAAGAFADGASSSGSWSSPGGGTPTPPSVHVLQPESIPREAGMPNVSPAPSELSEAPISARERAQGGEYAGAKPAQSAGEVMILM